MPLVTVRKADPEDPILQVASGMESRMQSAFLEAVQSLRNSVAMPRLIAAIAARDANQVLAVLAIHTHFVAALRGAGLSLDLRSMRDALQETFQAGAQAAAAALPTATSVALSFNRISPEAIQFLQSYEFKLVEDLTAQTEQALRQGLLRAFQTEQTPREVAAQIRATLGLTANQEQAIANYRAALEGGDLAGALGRALRDRRFDGTVRRVLTDQQALPAARIDQLVERYRERMLRYRARMIARTETVRAANAGQSELWRQARAQDLLPEGVRRKWIASGDEHTCPICADLHHETAGLEEEFEPGILAPPAHPHCRCTTTLVYPKHEADEAAEEIAA